VFALTKQMHRASRRHACLPPNGAHQTAFGSARAPPREFARADKALRAYEALEREHFGDESVQIVLLGGESLDAIKVTHPNYFERLSVEFKRIRPYFAPT
jgi:hypothetical protein